MCRSCYNLEVKENAKYIYNGGSQHIGKSGLTNYMEHKEEYKRRATERARENKKFIREYKQSLKCTDCGSSFPDFPEVIEFDHLDSSTKIAAVAQLLQFGHSIKKVKAEIKKCEPVCANCHRIRTVKRRNASIV